MNKSAASAASPDSVKIQAVTKSAASAASLRGRRGSGRLHHDVFLHSLDAQATEKYPKYRTLSEAVKKSAASAASLEYVKFQAVIKPAASAASLRGGRARGRLGHGYFFQFLAALKAKNIQKSQTLLKMPWQSQAGQRR